MINLLNAALTIIPPVTVLWNRATYRQLNDLGQWVTHYNGSDIQPIPIQGSFQPLEKAKYEQLGLDLNKHYFVFYSSNDLLAVERDYSGDTLIFQGRKYQMEDTTDWYFYNGWRGVTCVDIGAAS